MNHQLILNTLEFLKRSTLRGDEVPAYNEIVNTLSEMLQPKVAEAENKDTI